MDNSQVLKLKKFARSLVQGAKLELNLTPKPGLVDGEGSGSHPDLSFMIMSRSIAILDKYLKNLCQSLFKEDSFNRQRTMAFTTEQDLFRKFGTNIHRGYIFSSSMLLIAASRIETLNEFELHMELKDVCMTFFKSSPMGKTNGHRARKKYKVGGIIREALEGYPSVFDVALPAFRKFKSYGREPAAFYMLAKLMQHVEDTTSLHRYGMKGLQRIQHDGARLEAMIEEKGPYIAYLRRLNKKYIERNLTMGGVADLMALGFALLIANGEISYKLTDSLVGLKHIAQETFSPIFTRPIK